MTLPATAEDYFSDKGSAVAIGNRIELLFEPPAGVSWLIGRAAIRASAGAPTLRVYIGIEDDTNVVDGSDTGAFDIADNASGWYVPSGSTLRFVWTGAAADSVGFARIQGQVLKHGGRTASARSTMENAIGLPVRRPRKKVTRLYGGW